MRRGAVVLALVLALTFVFLLASREGGGPSRRERAGIVSLAPSITEMVFALGVQKQLVGVTSDCDFPEGARAIAKIGGYNRPNVELIVALNPRLVLVPEEGELLGPVQRLEDLGLNVVPIRTRRLEDVESAVEGVGLLLDRKHEGYDLAFKLRGRRDRVATAVAGLSKPRALLVIDRDPVIVAGRGTFGDDLLAAAGAVNVAGNTVGAYPTLGPEAIAVLDPEVIFDAAMGGVAANDDAKRERARAFWRDRFPGVAAVRAGRVETVDPDLLVRPGPRLLDGLELIARILHPKAGL